MRAAIRVCSWGRLVAGAPPPPPDDAMELSCRSCQLRPLVFSDATSLAHHANDREVWLNLRDRFPHPYTVADAEQYIASVAAQPVQTSFGIIIEGEAAGSVGLMLGDDIERGSAEIGYWLGRRYWGRGIMSEVVRAVTSYAFTNLGLIRIFAVPFATNSASVRVLEKAGYFCEGRMHRSAIKAGVVLDQFLYARVGIPESATEHKRSMEP